MGLCPTRASRAREPRYNGYDKYTKPVKIYRGEDSFKKLMEQMLMEVEYCRKIISTKFKKPLVMSEEEEREFQAATECHICGQE